MEPISRQRAESGRPGTKTFLFYAACFAALIVVMAVLEKIGMPDRTLGLLFIGFTILIYVGIGIVTRTMRASEFYVAGRNVPAVFTGMAAAAQWLSGTAFVAFAGALYFMGYDGFAFVLGTTGGLVLAAVLIVPYLQKSGAYTVPAFLSIRFGGTSTGLMGVIILVTVSFILMVAQIQIAGLVAERFLGLSHGYGIAVAVGCMVLCTLLGGMRALTWTQAAQYVVLIIAFLVPIVMISQDLTGAPAAQVPYGDILQEISRTEQQMLADGAAATGSLPALQHPGSDQFNFFALILCLMVGAASMPHLLIRFCTVPNARESRRSASWALLFAALLLLTVPAYAVFVKLEIFQSVIGRAVIDLPDWIYAWGQSNHIQICGQAATSFEAVTSACRAQGTDIVRLSDFAIARYVVVMAAPEIAGLPHVMTGLIGAGALAAGLAGANGLLLAIANSISHDAYHRALAPGAPTGRHLFVARLVLLTMAGAGGYVATLATPDILKLVAWAFSVAAAGNFPVLVLGIWWGRCTALGALSGMIAGFAVTLAYIIGTEVSLLGYDFPLLFGIDNSAAGLVGLPVGILVTIGVSLLTRVPSAVLQKTLWDIRLPNA